MPNASAHTGTLFSMTDQGRVQGYGHNKRGFLTPPSTTQENWSQGGFGATSMP
ncbi:hypothetical protein IMZ48_08770 [Candidatus Bathyarchaeota archaeon]|nr:hypothetical protein [Candidatus Bathyarchaeota archaeon]